MADDLTLFGMSPEQIASRGFESEPVEPEPVTIKVLRCNWVAFEVWCMCQQTVQQKTVTIAQPFGGSVTRSMRIHAGISAQEINAAMLGRGHPPDREVFETVHTLGHLHANRLNEEEARRS